MIKSRRIMKTRWKENEQKRILGKRDIYESSHIKIQKRGVILYLQIFRKSKWQYFFYDCPQAGNFRTAFS